jgi:hypothetical protein
MNISNSPTRSRTSDEVLLIQGTNVSDTYLICCGRTRIIDCRIGCFRSLVSILNIQTLGFEMICSLQRVEFAVEIRDYKKKSLCFVEFGALFEFGVTKSEEEAGPVKRDISMIMH